MYVVRMLQAGSRYRCEKESYRCGRGPSAAGDVGQGAGRAGRGRGAASRLAVATVIAVPISSVHFLVRVCVEVVIVVVVEVRHVQLKKYNKTLLVTNRPLSICFYSSRNARQVTEIS